MSDDLYHPPTCPIYVDRLIADTMDLTNEEFGAYMRLMLARQWPKGSIPADAAGQARVAGNISPARMKKIAAVIGSRLQPHPTVANAVHSPFMERVRESMRQRNKAKSENGKKGAQKRWLRDSEHMATPSLDNRESDGYAMAEPSQNDGFQIPIPRSNPSATPRDSAHTREDGTAEQADALSDYLLEAAIENGLEMGHHALDPRKWRYSNRADALKLVTAYGLEPCKVRALALIVAVKTGKITDRRLSTALLFRCWTYRELSDVVKAAATEDDEFVASLRASEVRANG